MAISAVLLGKRLKQAREARHFTQEYVAERIDLSVSHLSKIECGKKPVYLDKLAVWCDVLGVPIGQVVTDASMPEAVDIAAAPFSESCSPETLEDMRTVCGIMARIEERARH